MWGSLISFGSSEPSEKVQAAIGQVDSTHFQISWPGLTNYTFFPMQSPNRDLMSFTFMPIPAYIAGAGPQNFLIESDSQAFPKGFYKIKYTDLNPANLAGDGIDALFKINVLGIDPFTRDLTDGDLDGLSDAFERYFFGGLDIATPGGIGSADGLSNAEKDALGLDPSIDYSAPTATQNSAYTYDPVGRLTGVTGPAAATFVPDEEGNLLNAH